MERRDSEGTPKRGFLATFNIGNDREPNTSKYITCWNTPYKNKLKPNGQMPKMIDKSGNTMG